MEKEESKRLMKEQSIGSIIIRYFKQKKRANPSFSIRALARDLNLDPSFLNRILNNKVGIPVERLAKFIEVLEIDSLGEKEIKLMLIKNYAKNINFDFSILSNDLNSASLNKNHLLNTFEEHKLENITDSLFYPWYKMALLEIITLKDFKLNFDELAEKLNVHPDDLKMAWDFLVRQKLIQQTSSGAWKKVNSRIRFSTKESLLNARRFHKEIMAKAIEEMYHNTDKKSFQNRYVTSATLAVNSRAIEKIRIRLQEMVLEVVELGTQGECDKLYAINFNFFPLIHDK